MSPSRKRKYAKPPLASRAFGFVRYFLPFAFYGAANRPNQYNEETSYARLGFYLGDAHFALLVSSARAATEGGRRL